MPLPVQSASQFVAGIQNAIVAFTSKVKNFTSGSVAGAITNAVAAQLLFIQQQAVYQVAITRAATSNGADLTSFVADYLLSPPRLLIVAPYGQATFGKYQAATTQCVIPVGSVIQTPTLPPNSPVQYLVIADPTNVNYNPALGTIGGYAIQPGGYSVNATVQAIIPSGVTDGTTLNVQPGALSVIVTPGIPCDTVTNATAILNGVAQETDPALRVRFQKYISSLTKGSLNAVATAILSVQAGLSYVINEGLDPYGGVQTSNFAVIVDDGSGAVSPAILANIATAIDVVRAAGITRSVTAPTNVTITVLVNGTTYFPNFSSGAVKTALQAAIIAWVNTNGVGGANVGNAYTPSLALSYADLLTVIAGFIGTGVGQGLMGYSSVTINSVTGNISLTGFQLARASAATVTIN